MTILIISYILWNIIVFAAMGIDKRKAIKNKWRISEHTLLLMAFLMGGIGECIGAQVFHHKTQKLKFRILLPISVVVNVGVISAIIYIKYIA